MDGEPRYLLVVLDSVLRNHGCRSETSKRDGVSRAWLRFDTDGKGAMPSMASYTPEDTTMTIAYNAVVSIAHNLRLDPDEILAAVERAGGLDTNP